MSKTIPDRLVVFEMANNHMGDISHGLRIIREYGQVCRQFPEFNFAFKLQYRDLDTFIHSSMRGRDDVKFIKRFSETRLSRQQFDELVNEIRANGFLAMSTPFDEASVDLIDDQNLDILKVASCSFNDWPLLERAVKSDRPIIASTAGASLEAIDQVVSFLTHRQKDFAIMHCVAEYPCADDKLHLGQIDFLKKRYPGVRIGFSTHEVPDNQEIIKMAVAKGAQIFEKHVGVPTSEYPLNAYSSSPRQVQSWLEAARYAYNVCGVGDQRSPENPAEIASLRDLRRGVFARRAIRAGEVVRDSDVYFAFPPQEGQFTANEWSKYAQCTAAVDIAADLAIGVQNSAIVDNRSLVWSAAQKVKALIKESGITFPGGTDLEISHHYGMEHFDEFGLTMLTVVNREYCKKILVSLPGQKHPEQYHEKKEETFHILYGKLDLTLDGITASYQPGDVIHVSPGVRHAFVSSTGAVIEEISSTHYKDDSFYTDEEINKNKSRKTLLTYWMD